MTLAQSALGATIVVPLLAAAVAAVLPTVARRVIAGVAALTVALASGTVVASVASGNVVELAMGGFAAPLGITLRADGLSALFLSLTIVVGVIATLYALFLPESTGQRIVTGPGGAIQIREGHPGFWPLWLGCWAGLNAVFVAGDLFNFYVGLELVGLCAVALVALGGREAWAAALRYLFVAVFGSLLFLIAVALVVSATGTLDLKLAAEVFAADDANHQVLVLALALASVGLCLKLALVPMHRG